MDEKALDENFSRFLCFGAGVHPGCPPWGNVMLPQNYFFSIFAPQNYGKGYTMLLVIFFMPKCQGLGLKLCNLPYQVLGYLWIRSDIFTNIAVLLCGLFILTCDSNTKSLILLNILLIIITREYNYSGL